MAEIVALCNAFLPQRSIPPINSPIREKLLEAVDLYMKPPDNAVVLCVDEKTGIQAIDRTQPMLPLHCT
jgi:hypothetical protein